MLFPPEKSNGFSKRESFALKPGPGGEVALLHMDLLGQQSLGKSSKHISTKLVVKDGDLPLVESVKKITLNKKRSGRRFKPQNSTRKFPGEGCVGFPISTVSTHLIDLFFCV